MTVVAMLAAAGAAWFAVRPPRRRARPHTRALPRSVSVRLACAVTGVVVAIAWGEWMGVLVGVAVALGTPALMTRLESRADRARREAMARQAPSCSDLLAACLSAGASPAAAARAVADALGDPIAVPLRRLISAHDLGADPLTAWSGLATEPIMRPIARAAVRSAETGAPLAQLLGALADDQRDEGRARAEAAARSAGVRSVAPLAACFLPAFLLVGVVPIVASLALPLLA